MRSITLSAVALLSMGLLIRAVPMPKATCPKRKAPSYNQTPQAFEKYWSNRVAQQKGCMNGEDPDYMKDDQENLRQARHNLDEAKKTNSKCPLRVPPPENASLEEKAKFWQDRVNMEKGCKAGRDPDYIQYDRANVQLSQEDLKNKNGQH